MDHVRVGSGGERPRIVLEVARRTSALLLLIAAAVGGFGYGLRLWAAIAVALAIFAYVLPHRPIPPEGALHHERWPSVYMPDVLGFLLATTFLSLPFIISAGEPWLGGPWFLMLFIWPPGLIALAIFWMAIRYQSFWVKLAPNGLTVSTVRGIETLTFTDIAGARAETKRPPRWLGPLLVLFGGWRGAGIALLHADTERHAVLIDRSDGTVLRLPADAFPGMKKVIKALQSGGVPLTAELRVAVGGSVRGQGRGKKTGGGGDARKKALS